MKQKKDEKVGKVGICFSHLREEEERRNRKKRNGEEKKEKKD